MKRPTDVPGPMAVVVRVAWAPDRRARVLLQLPDGYILIPAPDARRLAATLLDVADEVDEVS